MKRAGIVPAAVLATALQATAGAQWFDPNPAGELWVVEPVDQVHAVVPGEDGSLYVGGSTDGGGSCLSRATAFLRKTDPEGNPAWQLGGSSSLPGACWNGDTFLGQLTSVDEAAVVYSSLHGIALDPATGLLGVTGEVLLAWEDGATSRPTTARGAFAALVTPYGQVVGDAYLGTMPDGPPLAQATCEALCELAGKTRGAQFGGRAATFAPGRRLAVTGFHVPAAVGPEPVGDTSFFTALFDRDLRTTEWIHAGGTPGHDSGLGIAANDDGDLLVVGYGGERRDLLLAWYQMDGTLARLRYAVGPMDDLGLAAAPLADRHWLVTGRITDECTLDGRTLGVAGPAQQDVVLEVDSELQLVASEVTDPFPSGPPGTFEPVADGMIEFPDVVELAAGELGTGGIAEVNASDGYRLRAIETGTGGIRLSSYFDLPSEPMVLKEVTAEVHTDYCYTATFRMRHLDTGDLVTLSEKDVCPGGPASLSYAVPEEQSRDLGIDGSEILPIVMRIDLEIRFRDDSAAPFSAKSAGSTKDASVEQVKAKVDYAE